MNEILDPPAERDLPPRAAYAMRARLLRAAGRRSARAGRLRIALAGLALSIAAAGVVAGMWDRPGEPGSRVRLVAMGLAETSPSLHDVAERCLRWHAEGIGAALERQAPWLGLSMHDLAVTIDAEDHALVLFMNDAGYATCDSWVLEMPASGDTAVGRSIAYDRWLPGGWLPGPVQRLLLTSTEVDGGDVAVSGRVSARVDRLVLDHGDGRTTPARLSGGAFGLLTTDARLSAANNPELVSYDAEGSEIDRRPLFQAEDQLAHCYTTPAGEVVYGRSSDDCRPAEAWGR
ncbi:hypothetical protein GCM10011608_51750 [Micromonospora sonchi]|uniref:Uncharacterized protein n=1 Tax=Micromonospora sonchi TaxID=1763543 RepID=A0A917X3C3_9ACTN|nr:hypothetical protein [Micromonospora sonchi]GGM60360.1 hypothetical protein GCM10011608_51750 [Micromonospora sonchi]